MWPESPNKMYRLLQENISWWVHSVIWCVFLLLWVISFFWWGSMQNQHRQTCLRDDCRTTYLTWPAISAVYSQSCTQLIPVIWSTRLGMFALVGMQNGYTSGEFSFNSIAIALDYSLIQWECLIWAYYLNILH